MKKFIKAAGCQECRHKMYCREKGYWIYCKTHQKRINNIKYGELVRQGNIVLHHSYYGKFKGE